MHITKVIQNTKDILKTWSFDMLKLRNFEMLGIHHTWTKPANKSPVIETRKPSPQTKPANNKSPDIETRKLVVGSFAFVGTFSWKRLLNSIFSNITVRFCYRQGPWNFTNQLKPLFHDFCNRPSLRPHSWPPEPSDLSRLFPEHIYELFFATLRPPVFSKIYCRAETTRPLLF